MSHIYNPNYIISSKSITIDAPTDYCNVLFTKTHIYVTPFMPLNGETVLVDGKTGYQHFVDLMNAETDPDLIRQRAGEIVSDFEGQEFDITQLKNMQVKNGLLSRGLYMRENIDTFKKFNRAITGGGKELYANLIEFYKDFKPMSW